MGRELYDTEPVFRAQIDACDRILAPLLGASLTELMLHGDDHDAIHLTRVAQPALVALQLALAALWKSWGVTPSVVLGHSLGEVAAAIYAGVLSLEDGLTLVAHRARLMASAPAGAMLAVTASLAQVTDWLAGTELDIAAINGPQSIVVSGARDAIDAFTARLCADGITARRLIVPLASHARLMDSIVRPLHDAIAHLPFHVPTVPLLANLTGRLATAGDLDASYWSRHVREPVRFHDSVLALRTLDIDVCLELGPDATLTNLITAAGLLPAGGCLASLQRGASPRATMLGAADALHAQGQDLAWNQILAVAGPARGATPPDLATADRRRSRAAARSLALLTITLPRRAHRSRPEPQTPHARVILDGLVRELASTLGATGDLDLTRSVAELGGDSFTAMIFRHRVERRYAIKLPLDAITTEQPVSALLDQLAASIAGAATDTDRTDERRVA
jgi:acyl transferase domain-containing protein